LEHRVEHRAQRARNFSNAYLVELWGILEGLKHVRRLNFRVVELHIDSLVVVRNIMDNKSSSIIGKFLEDEFEDC
jgi:ribonuclease HI